MLKMYARAEEIKFLILLSTVIFGVMPTKINTKLANNYGYFMANDCQYNTDQPDDLPYAEGENFTLPKNSIFFVETSCEGGLNFRQACSVESAAKANPSRQVNVLFTVPITKERLKEHPLNALLKYPNVKFYRIHLHKFGKGTPLKTIMRHDLLQSTRFIHHAADVLKYLTLYKFGGIFVDLDVIVVKSFDTLPRSKKNFVEKEDRDTLSTAVVAFSNDPLGRILASETVELLKYEFNPYERIANGAEILRKVLAAVLKDYKLKVYNKNDDIVMKLLGYPKVKFAIYSPHYFTPIHYTNFKHYFLPGELNLTDVYGIHMYNSLSKYKYISEDSMYANLADKFCPKTIKLYKFRNIRKNKAKKMYDAKVTERYLKLQVSG